jgi:MFS family permease
MTQSHILSKKERWTYIIVASICMVATFPGRTQGLGLVTEFILADLHIDRTVYGYYNLAATLIGALFCIPVGSMLDKLGCRKVLLLILISLGISVLCMSMASDRIFFFVSLVFTRGFGQSALSVASITLISKYFPKDKLGSAMGIYAVFTALFFVIAFVLMGFALTNLTPIVFSLDNAVVSIAHWRVAWGSVGLIILFLCVPLILFAVRASVVTSVVEVETGRASSLRQDIDNNDKISIPYRLAIRTNIFWVFALSISLFGLINSGVGLYNESILAERGFDAQTYYILLALGMPFALISNLGVGYLAQKKVKLTYLLFFSLLFMGLLKFAFPFIQTIPQVYAYTIALSLSAGALTVLFFIVWADIFGKKEVGKIQGLAQMMSVVASAVGPLFFAYSKQWTDSYSSAFFISGGLTLVFAVLAFVVKSPSADLQQKSD